MRIVLFCLILCLVIWLTPPSSLENHCRTRYYGSERLGRHSGECSLSLLRCQHRSRLHLPAINQNHIFVTVKDLITCYQVSVLNSHQVQDTSTKKMLSNLYYLSANYIYRNIISVLKFYLLSLPVIGRETNLEFQKVVHILI